MNNVHGDTACPNRRHFSFTISGTMPFISCWWYKSILSTTSIKSAKKSWCKSNDLNKRLKIGTLANSVFLVTALCYSLSYRRKIMLLFMRAVGEGENLAEGDGFISFNATVSRMPINMSHRTSNSSSLTCRHRRCIDCARYRSNCNPVAPTRPVTLKICTRPN